MDTKVYGFVKDNENQLSDDSKASVSSIMELQSLEKSLHSQLNQEVAANRADATEQQKLVDRINELTSMRQNLYQTLGSNLESTQDNLAHTRNNLVQQLTTSKIVEEELNNAKQVLSQLKQRKFDRLRMVEINNYISEKNRAYADLMKTIIYVAIPVIILLVLGRTNSVPDKYLQRQSINDILIILGVITIAVGMFFILRKAYDISRRNNMNFAEYDFDFNEAANNPTLVEYDRNALSHDFHMGERSFEKYADEAKGAIVGAGSTIAGAVKKAGAKAEGALGKASSDLSDLGSKAESGISNVAGKAGAAMGQAGAAFGKAGSAMGQAGSALGKIGDEAKSGLQTAKGDISSLFEESKKKATEVIQGHSSGKMNTLEPFGW